MHLVGSSRLRQQISAATCAADLYKHNSELLLQTDLHTREMQPRCQAKFILLALLTCAGMPPSNVILCCMYTCWGEDASNPAFNIL